MAEKGPGYPALGNRIGVTAGLTGDQKMKEVDAFQSVQTAPEGMVRKSPEDSGSGPAAFQLCMISAKFLSEPL